MDKIDDKDLKILELLKSHAEYTTRQIAKRTLIPATTVHNRIKKLRKDGVIRKFTVELDNKKMGRAVAAYILTSIDLKLLKESRKTQHDIANEIKKLPEVEHVDIVTGTTDLVVKVRVKDIEAYDSFLLKKFHGIDAIASTQSLVVISEF